MVPDAAEWRSSWGFTGSDEWIAPEPRGLVRTQENNKPMKVYYQLKKDMLGRVLGYKEGHPIPATMTRGTTLFTKVGTLDAAMTNHGGTQLFGLFRFLNGFTG